MENNMRIAIVGAGWYGCHMALELSKLGVEVILFEKSDKIFSGISGTFGIRLHAGPHYPRSEGTREYCHKNFRKFEDHYPELVNHHKYSIYAIGNIDANGRPSKVSPEVFDKVCTEFQYKHRINPEEYGFRNLLTAHSLDEPSMSLGTPLRKYFVRLLENANINVRYNVKVDDIEYDEDHAIINGQKFDYVINATSFKDLLPRATDLPQGITHIYQPCLALVYEAKAEAQLTDPISFIAMDGWFPCLMPYLDGSDNQYILTHGKWTILDSCKKHSDAQSILDSIDDEFVLQNIKPPCEKEMLRFNPGFKKRFTFKGFKGSVIAKPVTNTEFRSAITFFEVNKKMIHIIPGKVSCIFSAFEEVLSIINKKDLVTDEKCKNFQFANDGVLASHQQELKEKIEDQQRNTCYLKNYTLFQNQKSPKLYTQFKPIDNEMMFYALPAPRV